MVVNFADFLGFSLPVAGADPITRVPFAPQSNQRRPEGTSHAAGLRESPDLIQGGKPNIT
jgi:hypothetical protein